MARWTDFVIAHRGRILAVWIALFLYVWRLTTKSQQRAERLEELEREVGARTRR